jgi:hypothetical protein
MFTTSIASIYLVNVSIQTNKYLNPPNALGNMPTISILQIVKGICMLRCLLLENLAAFALGDNFHRVILCCRPEEVMPEILAYD